MSAIEKARPATVSESFGEAMRQVDQCEARWFVDNGRSLNRPSYNAFTKLNQQSTIRCIRKKFKLETS